MSSIINNNVSIQQINSLLPQYSSQASYAEVTASPATLSDDVVFVFCNLASALTLTLPTPTYGKNLFIVNKGSNALSTVSSATSIYVDIEGGAAQAGILPGSAAGGWAHLVGNGTNWVAVSKNKLLP